MTTDSYWKRLIFRPGPVLDPAGRLSEVVFGLIMVLTFTGSVSVSQSGRDDIRLMLISALGCNIAWGVIDGLMYLMNILMERGQSRQVLEEMQKNSAEADNLNLVDESLPPLYTEVLSREEKLHLIDRIRKLPPAPTSVFLTFRDWKGAAAIFLLVFISTFPATIPFMVMDDVFLAKRVSNIIALVLLFITGFYLGRQAGYNPWWFGLATLILGVLLVLMTIALGG